MHETLTWSEASAACQAAGQHLASVQSAAENALLVTAAAGNRVWIGGTDAASEGTWVWSPSGTPLSYANWGVLEPNNAGNGEDCLNGPELWNDLPCTAKQKYVCQTLPGCTVATQTRSNTFTSKASLRTAATEYDSNAAAAIAKYGAIAGWCVSGVTDMEDMFKDLHNFNADISGWDTSGVTSMKRMFWVCSSSCPVPTYICSG